jgi:hypothetical protein
MLGVPRSQAVAAAASPDHQLQQPQVAVPRQHVCGVLLACPRVQEPVGQGLVCVETRQRNAWRLPSNKG